MAIFRDRMPGVRDGGGGAVVRIKEKQMEVFCGDGTVLYCDRGSGDVNPHTQ